MKTRTFQFSSGIWPFRKVRTYSCTARVFFEMPPYNKTEWYDTEGRRAKPKVEEELRILAAQEELGEWAEKLQSYLADHAGLDDACAKRHANGAYGWSVMKTTYPVGGYYFAERVAKDLAKESA